MSWLKSLFGGTGSGVERAQKVQQRRGNATHSQNLEPIVGGAIVSLPIPSGWRRIDHSGRRQFVPPEAANVGGKNSAEINVFVAGPASASALDNLAGSLGKSYASFSLLESGDAKVPGADVSQYIRFRYKAGQSTFIDAQTHAVRNRWHCIVICTAADQYKAIYNEVFDKVHKGVKVS